MAVRNTRAIIVGILTASIVYVLLSIVMQLSSVHDRSQVRLPWGVDSVDAPPLCRRGSIAGRPGGPAGTVDGHAQTVRSGGGVRNMPPTMNVTARQAPQRSGQIKQDRGRGRGSDVKTPYGKSPSDKANGVKQTLLKRPFLEDTHYQESNCPMRLSSMAVYSRWFGARYRPRVKVFMDWQDADNWRRFSSLTLPYGFGGENNGVFQKILKHPNFLQSALSQPNGTRPSCLRCAVVGCGGVLKGSGAGEEIDGHDKVFRLNNAFINGKFMKDVGNKTSYYVFFPESMRTSKLTDKSIIFIYSIFKAYDMTYALSMYNRENPPEFSLPTKNRSIYLPRPRVDPTRLKIIHPDFFRYVFADFLDGVGYRPTTGAMAVFLALHMCDQVTIYGFGYDPRFTVHYYDMGYTQHDEQEDAVVIHNVTNERRLWEKLHAEGVLRLFKRDP